MLEAHIQMAIVKMLRANKNILAYSVPNEQSTGNPVRTGQLISMGMLPGAADLNVLTGKGKVAFIEVKNEIGRQSERQKTFQAWCQEHGYPYRVVRSVSEAEEFIDDCLRSDDT